MTNLEAGKQAASVTTLLDLADALGVSATVLLAEAGFGKRTATAKADETRSADPEVDRWKNDLISQGRSRGRLRGSAGRAATGGRT